MFIFFPFLILIKSSWNIVQAMLSPLNNKWRGCFHADLSTGPTKNKNINSDFENYWWKSVSLVAEFIVSVKLLTIQSIYLSRKVGFSYIVCIYNKAEMLSSQSLINFLFSFYFLQILASCNVVIYYNLELIN